VQAPVSRAAVIVGPYVRGLPPNPLAVADAVPAVGVAAMVSTVLLCVAVVLPVSSGLQPQIKASILGSQILGHASFVQRPVARLLAPPNTDPKRILESDPVSNPGEDAFLKLQFPADLTTQPDPAGEDRMLQHVNQARAQVSLSPLRADTLLQQAAREHSADMYKRHYFSHRTPDGKTPYDRLHDLRFHYVTAGENIAFAPDVDQAFDSLMKSPDHRANILNPDFRCIGIGAYKRRGGRRRGDALLLHRVLVLVGRPARVAQAEEHLLGAEEDVHHGHDAVAHAQHLVFLARWHRVEDLTGPLAQDRGDPVDPLEVQVLQLEEQVVDGVHHPIELLLAPSPPQILLAQPLDVSVCVLEHVPLCFEAAPIPARFYGLGWSLDNRLRNLKDQNVRYWTEPWTPRSREDGRAPVQDSLVNGTQGPEWP
jgi:uncharacterized protein YkwD